MKIYIYNECGTINTCDMLWNETFRGIGIYSNKNKHVDGPSSKIKFKNSIETVYNKNHLLHVFLYAFLN